MLADGLTDLDGSNWCQLVASISVPAVVALAAAVAWQARQIVLLTRQRARAQADHIRDLRRFAQMHREMREKVERQGKT